MLHFLIPYLTISVVNKDEVIASMETERIEVIDTVIFRSDPRPASERKGVILLIPSKQDGYPGSIALVGASAKKGQVGTALLRNLIDGGFRGRLCPVNPKYERVMGLPAFSSITKLNDPVDLAIIAVPIDQVPGVIGECSDAGVKTAIIVSAGGKEAGERGLALERKIVEAASASALRIVGPNCLGLMVPGSNLNASFA